MKLLYCYVLIIEILLICSNGRILKDSGFVTVSVGDTLCNVLDYGAKGDGITDDTSSIQKAIDSCGSNSDGGTVYFPAGKTFLTKALSVNDDHVALLIYSDAVLLISNDRSTWPSEQNIISTDHSDFAIHGGGTINGQGAAWWLHYDDFRPEVVHVLSKSKNVLINNITVLNCPTHCLELYSDNTEVSNVNIINPYTAGNTDGIDVHGSPFYVHNCYISTGDDNIAAHSNDTLVEDCTFGTGHGASIGSIGDNVWLKNITFRNINFDGTHQACRIKVDNDASLGRLWDVTYENLQMNNCGKTIIVTEFYDSDKEENSQFQIDGVVFRDIVASNSSSPGYFTCQKTSPCYGITLDNIQHKNNPSNFKWTCEDAHGTANNVNPPSCLLS